MRRRGGPPITDRISLLADVAEIVSRSHDLEQTLANVTELVAKRLDADVCSIYTIDAEQQKLILASTMGLDAVAVGSVEMPIGEGLVGLAAERGEPIAIEHAREHPKYRYFPETGEERFTSLLAAPLVVQSAVIGVIVIQTVEARRFDEPDIELLQTCASLLAPVVVNAQLLDLMSSGEDYRGHIVARIADAGDRRSRAGSARRGPRQDKNVTLRGLATARGGRDRSDLPDGPPGRPRQDRVRPGGRGREGALRFRGRDGRGPARDRRDARRRAGSIRPRVRGGLPYPDPDPRGQGLRPERDPGDRRDPQRARRAAQGPRHLSQDLRADRGSVLPRARGRTSPTWASA
jgi:GAF domain-containing protein